MDRYGERKRERQYNLLVHTEDPCYCNKLGKADEKERYCASKLVKQLKQVYSVAEDEGKGDKIEDYTDNG